MSRLWDPEFWLWGSSEQPPNLHLGAWVLGAGVLALATALLIASLVSGAPLRRAQPRLVHLGSAGGTRSHLQVLGPTGTGSSVGSSGTSTGSSAGSLGASSSSGSTGSSESTGSSSVPAPAQLLAQRAAEAEVNGEWTGLAVAPGAPLTPPVGQVGQPAQVQSLDLVPQVSGSQVTAASGTALVRQGAILYVAPVQVQLYNSQWVAIPQPGTAPQAAQG
jgi:hypothetical protein